MLKVLKLWSYGPHDTLLIDSQDERNDFWPGEIDRVVEDREIEILPLGIKVRAVGVLFLRNAKDC